MNSSRAERAGTALPGATDSVGEDRQGDKTVATTEVTGEVLPSIRGVVAVEST